MTDGFNQLGKYLKQTEQQTDFSLKRPLEPGLSVEKIRDVFDPEYPFEGKVKTPPNTESVLLSLYFGKRLPNAECCGDCYCGTTESYTSDSLISGSLYTINEIVTNSTVIYLDGAPAVRNTDYVEAGGTKLDFFVPFHIATISYVYSTGNCTEGQECIDTFPCPTFGLFSGLATVFADRFDMGRTEDSGETAGGCGIWASSINSATGVPVPSNSTFGGSISGLYATLGGPARVAGKTIEIVASLREGSDASFSPTNQNYSVSFGYAATSATNIRFTMVANARYYYLPFPDTPTFINQVETSFSQQFDFTIPTEFVGKPKMLRAAQYPNGNLYMSVWAEDAEESSGYSATLTFADFPTPIMGGDDVLLSTEMIIPTFYAVLVDNVSLKAIKIGAGLDLGAWGIFGSSGVGAALNICHAIPDHAMGPYFGDCGSETVSAGLSADTIADYHAVISFPVVIGDVPPDGSGKIAEIIQKVGSIDCLPGHPTAIRVKGLVYTSFITDIIVSVEFLAYPGTGVPAYNTQQFTGGLQVGSMLVPTNQEGLPFDILVPYQDGVARWGAVIPQVESIAGSLPFIPDPGFLGAPVHGLSVNFTSVTVEALQSVLCTANEICGLCIDERCPPIQDSFADVNYPYFLTPNNLEFNRQAASGVNMVVDQDDGTQITSEGDAAVLTWHGVLVDSFSFGMFRYPNSPFACRTSLNQNIFASFEFNINTLSPTGGYAEIGWGGWFDGPDCYIEIGGGAVTSAVINGFASIPVSISAGNWYTVEYKTEGADVMTRVYPSGGVETAWATGTDAFEQATPDTISNNLDNFFVEGGYQQVAAASNTTIKIRNIQIRSI